MKFSRITEDDISPKLLRASYFNSMRYAPGEEIPARTAYDYEIKLFIEGNGSYVIDNERKEITGSDIAFIRPGQRMQAIAPYSAYTFSFDLIGNSPSSKSKHPNYDIFGKHNFQPLYKCDLIDNIPTFYSPVDITKYSSLIHKMYNNAINPKLSSPLIIKSSILSLLTLIYNDINSFVTYPDLINKSLKYINDNLEKNLRIEQIAKSCNLSPTYFQHIFKKHVLITPNNYIVRARLEKSKEMLASTDMTASEIAYKSGFSSPAYFNYVFKKHINLSPIQFRNKFRQ